MRDPQEEPEEMPAALSAVLQERARWITFGLFCAFLAVMYFWGLPAWERFERHNPATASLLGIPLWAASFFGIFAFFPVAGWVNDRLCRRAEEQRRLYGRWPSSY